MSKPGSVEAATTLPLLVKPRSSSNRVLGVKDGALVVQVTAAPVEGAANRAVITTIAEALGVPGRNVEIIGGAKSRHKTVRIQGVTAETIAARFPT